MASLFDVKDLLRDLPLPENGSQDVLFRFGATSSSSGTSDKNSFVDRTKQNYQSNIAPASTTTTGDGVFVFGCKNENETRPSFIPFTTPPPLASPPIMPVAPPVMAQTAPQYVQQQFVPPPSIPQQVFVFGSSSHLPSSVPPPPTTNQKFTQKHSISTRRKRTTTHIPSGPQPTVPIPPAPHPHATTSESRHQHHHPSIKTPTPSPSLHTNNTTTSTSAPAKPSMFASMSISELRTFIISRGGNLSHAVEKHELQALAEKLRDSRVVGNKPVSSPQPPPPPQPQQPPNMFTSMSISTLKTFITARGGNPDHVLEKQDLITMALKLKDAPVITTTPASTISKPPTSTTTDATPSSSRPMDAEERRTRLQHEAHVSRILSALSPEEVLLLDPHPRPTKADIDTRFRDMSALVHPDKNPAKNAAQAFQKLQQAREKMVARVRNETPQSSSSSSRSYAAKWKSPSQQ